MKGRARPKAAAVGAPFELTVQDARALSFADASFDLVAQLGIPSQVLSARKPSAHPGRHAPP
jgi:hypothetical protein